MDGTRSGLTLAHTFRIGRDGEQLPFLRSACPSLDLYHREAAPGIPNHVPVAGTCRVSAAVGKVKWNVAPRPLFAVAHKRPPCDSTMERLIANPMPLPWGLVVKNASKICSVFSLGKPTPVSLTEISARPPCPISVLIVSSP